MESQEAFGKSAQGQTGQVVFLMLGLKSNHNKRIL